MEEEYRVQRALMEENTKRKIHTEEISRPESVASSSDEERDELPNAPPLPNRVPARILVEEETSVASGVSNSSTSTVSSKNTIARESSPTKRISMDSLVSEEAIAHNIMQKVNLDSNSPAPIQFNDNASESSLESSPVKLLKGLSIDDIMRKVHKSPKVGEAIVEESVDISRKPPVNKTFFIFLIKRIQDSTNMKSHLVSKQNDFVKNGSTIFSWYFTMIYDSILLLN